MGQRLAFLPVVLAVAGCASPWPPPRSREAAPLYRLAAEGTVPFPFGRAPEARTAAPPARPISLPPERAPKGNAISIEVRVEAPDGKTVVAPRIVSFTGQRAKVQVISQLAYIRDFDVEREKDAFIVDPVIGIAQEGLAVEMTALPGPAGNRTSLAFDLRTARLHRPVDVFPAKDLAGNTMSIQLPCFDRGEASGVRPMEHGVWGLLARLPHGKDESLSVLVRLEPIDLEGEAEPFEAEWESEVERELKAVPSSAERFPQDLLEDDADSLPARASRGELPESSPGLLELRGVILRTEFPAGSVVEAAAAKHALDSAESLDPADLRLSTGLVPGAHVSCLLQEAYLKDYEILTEGGSPTADPEVGEQVSGLRAEVEEGGALRLTWTATSAWDVASWSPTDDHRHLAVEVPSSSVRQALVVPGGETRLVVLSRLVDGRSAGVLVRFRPEGEAVPR